MSHSYLIPLELHDVLATNKGVERSERWSVLEVNGYALFGLRYTPC